MERRFIYSQGKYFGPQDESLYFNKHAFYNLWHKDTEVLNLYQKKKNISSGFSTKTRVVKTRS